MKLNPYHPTWFHLAPFMDYYLRCEYEKALAEALKFNYAELYWDPLMRAAALGQLGRLKEAKKAIDQLLKLEANFRHRAHRMIGHYVKVDDLVDKIVTGLQKAGLGDLE
jgi:adenylate cyclase